MMLALWYCHINSVPSVCISFFLQIKARLHNPFCIQVAALQSQISEEDFLNEMKFIKDNINSIQGIEITNCS